MKWYEAIRTAVLSIGIWSGISFVNSIPRDQDKVSTHMLEIVDENNKPVCVIQAADVGGILEILDSTGTIVCSLGAVSSGGGALGICNEQGKVVGAISVDQDGFGGVAIADDNGRLGVKLGLDQAGDAEVLLFGKDNAEDPIVMLGGTDRGEGVIVLQGKDDQRRTIAIR